MQCKIFKYKKIQKKYNMLHSLRNVLEMFWPRVINKKWKKKLFIRQGQYWQIAYYRFLEVWNAIKIRCSNTVFYVYFITLFQNFGLIFLRKRKNCITTSNFYKICLHFWAAILYLILKLSYKLYICFYLKVVKKSFG